MIDLGRKGQITRGEEEEVNRENISVLPPTVLNWQCVEIHMWDGGGSQVLLWNSKPSWCSAWKILYFLVVTYSYESCPRILSGGPETQVSLKAFRTFKEPIVLPMPAPASTPHDLQYCPCSDAHHLLDKEKEEEVWWKVFKKLNKASF